MYKLFTFSMRIFYVSSLHEAVKLQVKLVIVWFGLKN